MQLLFENQEQWAYTPDFENRLTQYAKLAGMNSQEIQECFASQELQKGITENIQQAQQKWAIQSTPTFIFGEGEETIEGNQPYSVFEDKLNRLLKESE